jgi:hypothetical protein
LRPLPVIALLLAVLLATAACADGGARPTPSPVPPTATVAPSPTRARPTATATVAPSPTSAPATPAATAGDASGLLRNLQGSQQSMTVGRSLMVMEIESEQAGKKEAATLTIELVMAEPDSHMKMSSTGPLASFVMEIISKDDTTYLNIDGEWTALPGGGQSEFRTGGTGPFEMDEMEALLGDASSAAVVGRRLVRGTECEVISFTLPPDRMRELAAMGVDAGEEDPLSEDAQVDQFSGEVAIGVADQMLHEMTMKIGGYSRAAPSDRFSVAFTFAMWDVNSPDVVVTVPLEASAGAR